MAKGKETPKKPQRPLQKKTALIQEPRPVKSAKSIRQTNAKEAASRIEKDSFYIVGIGASAGGLEAFEQFFRNMPAESGMAFVLIPHLDPTHKSIMTDLLQRYTNMKI
ncbi:MAG TPA: chemotaxis protein CheB, partial [Thermodesulfovibrionales bacterium]|nr:chemotaxis protein CheB [Thermodesulfovibrionales bacterium]